MLFKFLLNDIIDVNGINLDVNDTLRNHLQCHCWRRWYPYATLIHRETESESMDALAERLEKSMDCHDPVIIIRCFHLGELISAWINTGYTVRDIASVLSLSSLILSSFQKGRIPQALAATGFGLQLIHGYFWRFDRLSEYAIQPRKKLPEQESFKEINEVVLVRKPCTGNYLLRAAVTLCSIGVCGYFYYKDYVD
ncbi:hypothetical protein AVEN_183084-1 [Araneus ventricosus]|uniref:Uncharacterized protein n=1 Tax=Araneus ventricosus TaxID=182803 RepID=A0A4Y2A9K4_ARAVE|nr:hypothetical protein AVEN_183084-1 [Araneus ventricosus]